MRLNRSAVNYPAMTVDLDKIEQNTRAIAALCAQHGVRSAAVTKCYCGDPDIAEASVRGGAAWLADSRIDNLRRLSFLKVPKLLLRLPMISQVHEVVRFADLSLNSELDTIKALSEAALEAGKPHGVILMVDLGDLREGVMPEQAVALAGEILALKGVVLKGIGTNLTCYGGVLPGPENMARLECVVNEIEDAWGIHLELVSGGNSSSVDMLERGRLPKCINQLRFGEAILFGTEFAYGKRIKGTYSDAFQLHAEIIELSEKPSVPFGETGLDAFGNKPVFVDRGVRRRLILGIGKQDVILDTLRPLEPGAIVLGGSSDHLIVDVHDCDRRFKVGDIFSFNMHYTAVLSAMTSAYVEKIKIW